jgi:hypothetical protein
VYEISFPPADAVAGARALDYEISAVSDVDGKKVVKYVLPQGFYLPAADKRQKEAVKCVIAADQLPPEGTFHFEVRPRNSFGKTGAALTCEV